MKYLGELKLVLLGFDNQRMHKIFLSSLSLLFLAGCASDSSIQAQPTGQQEDSQNSDITQAEVPEDNQPFVLEISEPAIEESEAATNTFYLNNEKEIFYGKRQLASNNEEDILCIETYSDVNEIWGDSESLDITGMRLDEIANETSLLEHSTIAASLAAISVDKTEDEYKLSPEELDTLLSQLPIRNIPQYSKSDETTLTFTEAPDEITISVSNGSESYSYRFGYTYYESEEIVEIPEDDCLPLIELNTGDEAAPNFEAVTQSIAVP